MSDTDVTHIVDVRELDLHAEFDTYPEAAEYIDEIRAKHPDVEIKETMHVGSNRHSSDYEIALDDLIDGADTIYKRRALIAAWRQRTDSNGEPEFDYELSEDEK